MTEPTGKTTVIKAETREQIPERVGAALEKWQGYCERNWLNDTGDVFTPELKVKRFLDSLAYFLLSGNTQGIETNYKSVMHSKREIPASSCVSEVDNLLYATGVMSGNAKKEEEAEFQNLLEKLDARAERYLQPRAKRTHPEGRFHKHERLGIHGGEWCRVDTDGRFWSDGTEYVIDDQEIQYQPIPTDYGDLYDMDRILAYNGQFYDMNFDPVRVQRIYGNT